LTEEKVGKVIFIDGTEAEKCKIARTPIGNFVEVPEDAASKVIKEVI
jgi:hypothetical protein